MKKCPTCDKTFEDSMKFCQVDGTPLVEDEPAFDPYATMVGGPAGMKPPEPPAEETPQESAFEAQPEEPAAIAAPDNAALRVCHEQLPRDRSGQRAPGSPLVARASVMRISGGIVGA